MLARLARSGPATFEDVPDEREDTAVAGASAVTFREVTFDEVGRVPGPHYVRSRAFVVWVLGPDLAGIFATAPQRMPDIELAITLYTRLFSLPQKRLLFSDARRFGVDGPVFEALFQPPPRSAEGHPVAALRGAITLPLGWTRAWWVGAIALKVFTPFQTQVFEDPREAWTWLGQSEDAFEAVQDLTITLTDQSELRRSLEEHLRADPALTLERAARLSGSSVRSLQRALSAHDESFGALRDRVRADLASARLLETDDKIDAVATSAGFRSRSHFASWFRRVTGKTPAEFRETQRSKGSSEPVGGARNSGRVE